MMTFLMIMTIVVFGRLLGFAIRGLWGIGKIVLTLVFLPAIIVGGLLAGLFWLAVPLLLITGGFTLLAPGQRYY